MQFFTEAIRRRRRYLGESKKHIHIRIIDRCLSIAATTLTEEERSIVRRCTTEDEVIGMMYRALQHIRYVLKATNIGQAQRRLNDWFQRFQFHSCGVLAKIAKTLKARESAILATILSPFSNGKMEGTIKLSY